MLVWIVGLIWWFSLVLCCAWFVWWLLTLVVILCELRGGCYGCFVWVLICFGFRCVGFGLLVVVSDCWGCLCRLFV